MDTLSTHRLSTSDRVRVVLVLLTGLDNIGLICKQERSPYSRALVELQVLCLLEMLELEVDLKTCTTSHRKSVQKRQ